MQTSNTNTSSGKISLVGIGPGSLQHMTERARAAIAEADTVIGYVTYIKLVADLLEGKEVIRKSMTEELDRAIEALERAREGKKVALISSGDAGIYGMAGPTFEVLFQAGWTARTPALRQPPRWQRGSRNHPWHIGTQRLRRARWRTAYARLLRHLPVRPAHPLARHRPPPARSGQRRFCSSPV